MPRQFSPPTIPKTVEPWLYNAFRAVFALSEQTAQGISAIARGEVPDGSGTPLQPDLSAYFYLPGRTGGQLGYGGRSAAENVKFSSTADAAKGFIHLGYPTARLSVDEASALVGINKSAPASTLHLVGSTSGVGSAIQTNSVVTDNWGSSRSGIGGGTIGDPTWQSFQSNDGLTTYVAVNADGFVGTNPQKNGLNNTILPGGTYQVTISISCLSDNADLTKCAFRVSLIDSAGNEWGSGTGLFNSTNDPLTASELSMTGGVFTTITRTITCSGTPASTGNTANAVWLYASMHNSANTPFYSLVSYISIAQTGSSLVRWDLSSGTQSGGIDIFGRMGIGTGSSSPAAMLDIVPDNAATIGLRVKAAASQTGDLIRTANSSGTALSGVDSSGNPYLVANAAESAVLVSDSSGVGSWRQLVADDDEMIFYEDEPVYFK